MNRVRKALVVLACSILVSACAGNSYFKEATPAEPHAILMIKWPGPGAKVPIFPQSINGKPINSSGGAGFKGLIKEILGKPVFDKYLIQSGDTDVVLGGPPRRLGEIGPVYGEIAFYAQPGERYEVMYTVEPTVVIYQVRNAKKDVISRVKVKRVIWPSGPAEREKADALYEAASRGDTAAVQSLLNDGAEPDWEAWRVPNNFTALMIATIRGETETVKILIKAGADVDRRDIYGWTPLIHAAYRGHESIAAALIGAGANITLRSLGGYSAFLAADEGNVGVMKRLQEKGKASHPDKTALDWAKEGGNQKIVDMLEKAAARKK